MMDESYVSSSKHGSARALCFGGVILGIAAVLGILGAILLRLGVPALDFVKFLIFTVVVVYLPGWAAVGWLRLQVTRLEALALSMTLGMTLGTALYWVLSLLGISPLFPLWPLVALLAILSRLRGKELALPEAGSAWRPSAATWAAGGIYLLLFLTLYVSNLNNGVLQPSGDLILNINATNVLTRTAIARQLALRIPPVAPFMAPGTLSNYHYAMDLFLAMPHQLLGLDILDTTLRFAPLVLFGLLSLNIFIFTHELTSSKAAGLLALFLSVFGGAGFSFVAGILWIRPTVPGRDQPWEHAFMATTLRSLDALNSQLPALAIFFAMSFCLLKYSQTPRVNWLLVTAFCGAALVEFRVFMAAQWLLSLALGAALLVCRRRRYEVPKAFAATAILSLPLLAYHWYANRSSGQFAIMFQPGGLMLRDLWLFGFDPLFGRLRPVVLEHRVELAGVLLFFVLSALHLIGGLGLRVCVLPSLGRDVLRARPERAIRVVLGFFVFSGIALTWALNINPSDSTSLYGQGVWFYFASLAVLWILLAESMMHFWRRHSAGVGSAALAAVLLLSLPSSAQYFWWREQAEGRLTISAERLAALRYLEQETPADAVVLCDVPEQELQTLPVASLAGRAVVYAELQAFAWSIASPEEIEQRRSDVKRFLANPLHSADVLWKYGVDYVCVERDHFPVWPHGTTLTLNGPDEQSTPIPERRGTELTLVYGNQAVKIYAVSRD